MPRWLANGVLALAVLISGCYAATLVTLTPPPSPSVSIDGDPGGITDADVERAKQITKEIAEHFGFAPHRVELEFEDESVFSAYDLRTMSISLHLPDDRSHLNVAINDLGTTRVGEILRLIQADFKRMFEGAFPNYQVEVK